MKKNSEYIKFLFIGFCSLIIAYYFSFIIPPKLSSGINDLSYWYTYSFSKKSLKPLKFIGIAIDDSSLNKIPRRWPWPRSVYASIIKILDKEKVNTIGIDFAFIGEGENKEDDRLLKEALDSVSSRVVLAYPFDYKAGTPVLPLVSFRESAYSLGMVNAPADIDGKVRRLRGGVAVKDNVYYSFPVALSAAYLNQKPQDIISFLPLAKDRTFLINYLLLPEDIIEVSFSDVLENLEKLKQRYGNDFLKGALVLIYPEAEIFHDSHPTPLGRLPGGFLHLNGVADIVLKRFVKEADILSLPFYIFSLGIIFYILRYSGLASGLLLALGLLFANFWLFVLLNLKGIKLDYSRIVFFVSLFFISGSLYKYTRFLIQLMKIKDKVTLDPLRSLFTLRYFYYRLELEQKKIYFRKDLFLIFLHLEAFKDAAEDMPLDKVKNIWQGISSGLSLKGSFWSVYSPEEVVGGIISSYPAINSTVNFLKNNLEALLQEAGIQSKAKAGYLRLKKEYPVRGLIFALASELEKKKEGILFLKDSDLAGFIKPHYFKKETDRLLESFDEDIEEKNRQLLSLIENLDKEHAKTKEAFFQIITSLVNALEARDPYTEGHSERVCNYALMVAEKLGWIKEQKEKLRKAALLHDIGKIGIPDSILHKKDKLTDEEFDFIKRHEIIGVKILEPLKEIGEILPWIMYHHERWDGKGYPHGLAGDAIPEAAQIISLADVFDALITGRDYKGAFSRDEAIKEIVKGKGTRFNPGLTDIFMDALAQHQQQK